MIAFRGEWVIGYAANPQIGAGEVLAGWGILGGTAALSGAAAMSGGSQDTYESPLWTQYWQEKIQEGQAKKQQQATGESTPGNPQEPKYEPNRKHDGPQKGDDRRGVSPQPQAGASLMDKAVQVKPGSSVAVDRQSGKFVVYKTDSNGQTHGYETTWKGLRNDQQAALIKARQTSQRGNILPEQVP